MGLGKVVLEGFSIVAALVCLLSAYIIGKMGDREDHKFFGVMAYVGALLFLLLALAIFTA